MLAHRHRGKPVPDHLAAVGFRTRPASIYGGSINQVQDKTMVGKYRQIKGSNNMARTRYYLAPQLASQPAERAIEEVQGSNEIDSSSSS